MTFIAVQTVSLDQLDPSFEAANSSGNEFTPGDRVYFHIKNSNPASVTAVINDPNSTEPTGSTLFDPDITVVVEPGGERMVGPCGGSRFTDDADGYVHVTYTASASVTVAVFELSVQSG